jgi:hypothetical protein
MKMIVQTNLDEGLSATSQFLAMFHRIMREGQIVHSQTPYFPVDFDWCLFFETEVADEVAHEVEARDVLELAATRLGLAHGLDVVCMKSETFT